MSSPFHFYVLPHHLYCVGLAFPSSHVNPRPAANNEFFFQKIFGDGEFIAAGQLRIPPNGHKPSKMTKDNTYVSLEYVCPMNDGSYAHMLPIRFSLSLKAPSRLKYTNLPISSALAALYSFLAVIITTSKMFLTATQSYFSLKRGVSTRMRNRSPTYSPQNRRHQKKSLRGLQVLVLTARPHQTKWKCQKRNEVDRRKHSIT